MSDFEPMTDRKRALVDGARAVEAAMIYGGDGRILDHGWNITKLNEARPLIRAALSPYEEPRT